MSERILSEQWLKGQNLFMALVGRCLKEILLQTKDTYIYIYKLLDETLSYYPTCMSIQIDSHEAVCAAPAGMSAVLRRFLLTRCGVTAEVVHKSAVATRCTPEQKEKIERYRILLTDSQSQVFLVDEKE